jgi:hypothetical protein
MSETERERERERETPPPMKLKAMPSRALLSVSSTPHFLTLVDTYGGVSGHLLPSPGWLAGWMDHDTDATTTSLASLSFPSLTVDCKHTNKHTKYVRETNTQTKASAAPFALHGISQVIFSSPVP